MKATGILRRIDELGRVVIPKEIRKSMKMREGEELEIYTTDEEVVLKKYSELSSMQGFARSLVAAVQKVTGKSVVITDADKVIASSGKGVIAEGETVPEGLMRVASVRRKSVLEGKALLPLGVEGIRSQIVVPILVAGDLFGTFILQTEETPQTADEQLAATGAGFFENQINR